MPWRVLGAVPTELPSTPEPTAEQIVDRNVSVRGGLEAWRRVHAMVWSGRMDSGGAGSESLHFVLQQARPNRSRFAINTMGQLSVRVFDGQHGWKMRPSRGIKPDVEPFSAAEERFAQDAEVIDGPLIDYAAHGSHVLLGGLEDEHGRKAWRIDVVRASGARESVWIDAETFLDLRYDRTSFKPAGGPVNVSVFYHDYRNVDGLQIPGRIDIGNAAGGPSGRMVVEQITLNPQLDEYAFAEPGKLYRANASRRDARPGVPERRETADMPNPTHGPSAAVANTQSSEVPR